MEGIHLLGRFEQCECDINYLVDFNEVKSTMIDIVNKSGLKVIGENFYSFNQNQDDQFGWTGVILLSESHITIHCASADTEILTKDGWKHFEQVNNGEVIMTYNVEKNILEYQRINDFYVSKYNGKMLQFENQYLDSLITPDHKCVVKTIGNKNRKTEWHLKKANELPLCSYHKISSFLKEERDFDIDDDMLKLTAWLVAEGHYKKKENIFTLYQSKSHNPKYVNEIDEIFSKLNLSIKRTERLRNGKNEVCWYVPKKYSSLINNYIPEKVLTRDFVSKLSNRQAEIYINTLIKADGSFRGTDKIFIQKSKQFMDVFQELLFKNNYRTYLRKRKDRDIWDLSIQKNIDYTYINGKKGQIKEIDYNGFIFCPLVDNKTWVARRNNKIFITGNTYPERHSLYMDVFTCNYSANNDDKARFVMSEFKKLFKAKKIKEYKEIKR